jgi:hypothetical protein
VFGNQFKSICLKENYMKYQLLIIFILGLSLVPAGGLAGAADISGTWAFSVNLEGGPQNVPLTFIFKQAGEKLSGIQSTTTGDLKVSGTVKGNKVEFGVEGKNKSGEPFKNSFTGTIDSPTKMTGNCEFPKGPGNWTATKK